MTTSKMKIDGETYTIEQHPDGWIYIYGMIGTQLIQKKYLYYTLPQAKKLFKQDLTNNNF